MITNQILKKIKELIKKKSLITISTGETNLNKTIDKTWTEFKIDLNNCSFVQENKFSLSNGAILINEDCVVSVGGQIMLRGISNAYKTVTIRIKRGENYITVSSGYAIETTNSYSVISMSQYNVNLKKGDLIEMCVGSAITGTLEIGGAKYTYMSVSEI